VPAASRIMGVAISLCHFVALFSSIEADRIRHRRLLKFMQRKTPARPATMAQLRASG
jgi:hypothetical protein